ncbi:leucine/isoleucine/valine transporter subunit; ATP-binding component of ABC superfamily [uncultured Desulfatiglans sp.]|nr:leucine/isoleucine/valine transporter subunit; ATP-binding component of ABC superfamily [uncultured Desulfatiglans sp.]
MTPILQITSLNKSFGGLHVTSDVSFAVMPGEISAIIGPNGAGKTTLFNQITGRFRPDGGSIMFDGHEIIGKSPQQIVALGIGRAFQIASIFPDETVLNNIRVACLSKLSQTRKYLHPVEHFQQATEDAHAVLESLGLDQQAHRMAFELAHGDQKLLDIGIALALRPRLLLLDEPTAGMSPEERLHTKELILKLWKDFDLSLVFIEHDMDMVFGIAQTVRVLQQGTLLADDTPEKIRANKQVITAYLGEEF